MDDLWIRDAVQANGAVELIKEKFNNGWKRGVRVKDCGKQFVDVLLERTLQQIQRRFSLGGNHVHVTFVR